MYFATYYLPRALGRRARRRDFNIGRVIGNLRPLSGRSNILRREETIAAQSTTNCPVITSRPTNIEILQQRYLTRWKRCGSTRASFSFANSSVVHILDPYPREEIDLLGEETTRVDRTKMYFAVPVTI